MTSKLLAATTLMLVTTASAWAESADDVSRLNASSPNRMEMKQVASVGDNEPEMHTTSGEGDTKQ